MTDTVTGCAKTPLSDLLRRIPQEAVYNWTNPEEGRELWQLGSESAPIGRLAHEAADALDAMLAASPQGEGSSAEADTHRAADGAVVARWPVRVSWIYEHTHQGQRTQMAGTYGLTTTNTKGEGLRAVLGEIERQSEWVLERSPNTKTVITITLDADTPTTANSVGMSEANAPYRVTEGVKP